MVGRNDLRGMTDAWQAYIDLALGFTETSRKRATKVVKQMVGKSNATAGQVQSMAEELVNTGLANREAMVRLIRFELDKALGRVGLATAEEVGELTTRVRDLEEKLREAQGAPGAVPATEPATPAPAPTRKAPAKRAPAKTTAAKAAPAKTAAKAAPAKTAAKAAPATKAEASAPVAAAAGTPAGTSAAKKTVAKKTVAKKAVAAKSTGAGA
jgi:polyhydroxyalkanoate synthesis regulator phasin